MGIGSMKMGVLISSIVAALISVSSSAHATINFVVNGDFSQGNTGFTSGYKYTAPTSGALMPETLYTIAADPRSVHPYWVQLTGDHPMLIVNGATGSTATVWQESIATAAGQNYHFSASAADVCCNSDHPGNYAPSELSFQISSNGFASFQTLGTINTAPPGDAGQFQTLTTSFQTKGPIEIRIVDELTGRVGNDFAIENVSLTADSPLAGVSAAPEPATWAMMISGFCGLGGALRRRRALVLKARKISSDTRWAFGY